METRASFVLIGAFTIIGFLAAFGFVLWLAKVQIDRTYEQYDLLFADVSGLRPAAAVTYNGIDVGRVLTIALDRDDPSLVRVRIEILASTPIRADTIGTLSSQGVTGVGYISLAGGTAEAEPLRAIPPATVPVIRSELSVVQGLLNTGPDLLDQATRLIAEVRGFATPGNREAIAGILVNLENATGRIEAIATRAEETLARTDAALLAAESSFNAVDGVLRQDIPAIFADLQSAVESTRGAMDGVRALSQGELPQLAERAGDLIGTVGERIDTLTQRINAALDVAAAGFSKADGLLGQDVPALFADLKAAADSAAAALEGVRSLTQGSLPQLSVQASALIQDASRVIATFDSLARQIGNDPGRFLLGTGTPDYRRSQ